MTRSNSISRKNTRLATSTMISASHETARPIRSLVASIYDKSVEYISGGSNVPEIKEFFWKWRRQHNPSQATSLARSFGNLTLPGHEAMAFIGVFGATVADEKIVAAVAMLLDSESPGFDALIAPGHVSTVMGPEEWQFVVD